MVAVNHSDSELLIIAGTKVRRQEGISAAAIEVLQGVFPKSRQNDPYTFYWRPIL
jgi:hypothetical protein